MSFIFGGTTGQTAESIQRKRELARKMLDGVTSNQPKNVWEGIRAVGTALGSRVALNKADKQWQAGVDDANKQFAGLFAPRDVRQSFAPETGTMAPQMSEGSAPAHQSYVNGRVAQAHGDPDLASGIAETASALGIDPVDLATAISYETAGTFDPAKEGPTTQWGKHRGLIQFGEPQAQKYGVNWDDPAGSQLGAKGAIAKYLTDAGVKPGMGLMDVYSAINAGSVGKYGASDANNGGAPGTVADKVNQQMAGHREKAEQLMGFMPQQQPQQAIDAVAPQQAPQRAGIDPVLIQALSNPFLNKEQRAVIAGMVQQQMERPELPDGYLWNDPNNPNSGVTQIPGYDPSKSSATTWLAPVDEIGEDGKPVVVQYSNRGDRRIIEGAKPSNPIQKIDTGTEIQVIDSRTGNVLSRTAKNNQQAAEDKARGTALGKQEGENLASAAADFAAAENALTMIDSLRNDPNRERGTGKSAVFNSVPYTAGYDFQTKVDQVTSGAFMTAIQGLRGMGALSNAEGQTATRAVTRLTTASSEQEFLNALADYEAIVRQGRNKAAQRMGQLGGVGSVGQSPEPEGQGGDINDLVNQYAD